MNTSRPLPPGPLDGPIDLPGGPRRRWGRLAAVAILLTYALAISSQWTVSKDSGFYLTLGRNLAAGQGFALAGDPETKVPPGFPLMLAGMMKLRAGDFLSLNILMAALGLAAAACTWLLFRCLVSADWAVVLTVVVALSQAMVSRSGQVLSDVPFAVMVLAALWLYYRGLRADSPSRNGWEIASVLLVLACWVRVVGAPIAAAGALGLVLGSPKGGRRRAVLNALLVGAGLAATFAFFALYHRTFHVATASTEVGRIYRLVRGEIQPIQTFYQASGDLSRLIIVQRMPLWLCMLALVAPVAATMVRRAARRDWIGPLVVAFLIGGLCLAAPKLRTRYMLPLAPFLFLYLIEGWAWLFSRLARNRPGRVAAAVLGLLVVVTGMNLPRIIHLVYERHRADYLDRQDDGQWSYLRPAAEFLEFQAEPGRIFAKHPLSYLAGRDAPSIPSDVNGRDLTDEQVCGLLADLRIRYVVFDAQDVEPQYRSMRRYLAAAGGPAFRAAGAEIFRVPSSPPASQPATAGD